MNKKLFPDVRPAKRQWAPGGYLCTCLICGASFSGDKRAHHCAPCAYDIAWTMDEALAYIRPLEQTCFNMGFNIGLMGSVLHKGWSKKDLDIVAVPANWRDGKDDTTNMENCRKFLRWIGSDLVGKDKTDFSFGMWNNMTVKITYRHEGRLVDWFVSFHSKEGSPI